MAEQDERPLSPFQYAPKPAGPPVRKKRDVPDGLWRRCHSCEAMLYTKAVEENLDVCPECNAHFRIGAAKRIKQLTDPETFEELFTDIAAEDPLEFEWLGQSYPEYLQKYRERARASDAVSTGVAYIRGRRLALGVMNGEFIMGSMGSVVGEKVTLLIQHAIEHRLPLVIVCTSGGARMQEGVLSLMQMGKTSAELAKFDEARGLYISVMADPTTAGVLASFAYLADIVIAEPGALIGFAGERVIASTIKTELPEGFQRAEFLLEHGFVDRIVSRHELRSEIATLIDYCRK